MEVEFSTFSPIEGIKIEGKQQLVLSFVKCVLLSAFSVFLLQNLEQFPLMSGGRRNHFVRVIRMNINRIFSFAVHSCRNPPDTNGFTLRIVKYNPIGKIKIILLAIYLLIIYYEYYLLGRNGL